MISKLNNMFKKFAAILLSVMMVMSLIAMNTVKTYATNTDPAFNIALDSNSVTYETDSDGRILLTGFDVNVQVNKNYSTTHKGKLILQSEKSVFSYNNKYKTEDYADVDWPDELKSTSDTKIDNIWKYGVVSGGDDDSNESFNWNDGTSRTIHFGFSESEKISLGKTRDLYVYLWDKSDLGVYPYTLYHLRIDNFKIYHITTEASEGVDEVKEEAWGGVSVDSDPTAEEQYDVATQIPSYPYSDDMSSNGMTLKLNLPTTDTTSYSATQTSKAQWYKSDDNQKNWIEVGDKIALTEGNTSANLSLTDLNSNDDNNDFYKCVVTNLEVTTDGTSKSYDSLETKPVRLINSSKYTFKPGAANAWYIGNYDAIKGNMAAYYCNINDKQLSVVGNVNGEFVSSVYSGAPWCVSEAKSVVINFRRYYVEFNYVAADSVNTFSIYGDTDLYTQDACPLSVKYTVTNSGINISQLKMIQAYNIIGNKDSKMMSIVSDNINSAFIGSLSNGYTTSEDYKYNYCTGFTLKEISNPNLTFSKDDNGNYITVETGRGSSIGSQKVTFSTTNDKTSLEPGKHYLFTTDTTNVNTTTTYTQLPNTNCKVVYLEDPDADLSEIDLTDENLKVYECDFGGRSLIPQGYDSIGTSGSTDTSLKADWNTSTNKNVTFLFGCASKSAINSSTHEHNIVRNISTPNEENYSDAINITCTSSGCENFTDTNTSKIQLKYNGSVTNTNEYTYDGDTHGLELSGLTAYNGIVAEDYPDDVLEVKTDATNGKNDNAKITYYTSNVFSNKTKTTKEGDGAEETGGAPKLPMDGYYYGRVVVTATDGTEYILIKKFKIVKKSGETDLKFTVGTKDEATNKYIVWSNENVSDRTSVTGYDSTNGTPEDEYIYQYKDADDASAEYSTTVPTKPGNYKAQVIIPPCDIYTESSKETEFTIKQNKPENIVIKCPVDNTTEDGSRQAIAYGVNTNMEYSDGEKDASGNLVWHAITYSDLIVGTTNEMYVNVYSSYSFRYKKVEGSNLEVVVNDDVTLPTRHADYLYYNLQEVEKDDLEDNQFYIVTDSTLSTNGKGLTNALNKINDSTLPSMRLFYYQDNIDYGDSTSLGSYTAVGNDSSRKFYSFDTQEISASNVVVKLKDSSALKSTWPAADTTVTTDDVNVYVRLYGVKYYVPFVIDATNNQVGGNDKDIKINLGSLSMTKSLSSTDSLCPDLKVVSPKTSTAKGIISSDSEELTTMDYRKYGESNWTTITDDMLTDEGNLKLPSGTYYFRYTPESETDTYKSKEYVVLDYNDNTINLSAYSHDEAEDNEYTPANGNGIITGVNSNMEWTYIDNFDTLTDDDDSSSDADIYAVEGNSIEAEQGTWVYVRYKKDTDESLAATKAYKIFVPYDQDPVSGLMMTYDEDNNAVLTNVDTTMSYKINSGSYKAVSEAQVTNGISLKDGDVIKVKFHESYIEEGTKKYVEYAASKAVTMTVDNKVAEVEGENAEYTGFDESTGTINNLTLDMEYSTSKNSGYLKVNDDAVENGLEVEPGTYYVRYQDDKANEDGNYQSNESPLEITIKVKKPDITVLHNTVSSNKTLIFGAKTNQTMMREYNESTGKWGVWNLLDDNYFNGIYESIEKASGKYQFKYCIDGDTKDNTLTLVTEVEVNNDLAVDYGLEAVASADDMIGKVVIVSDEELDEDMNFVGLDRNSYAYVDSAATADTLLADNYCYTFDFAYCDYDFDITAAQSKHLGKSYTVTASNLGVNATIDDEEQRLINISEDLSIKWYINGRKVGEGLYYTGSNISENVTIKAVMFDENGNEVAYHTTTVKCVNHTYTSSTETHDSTCTAEGWYQVTHTCSCGASYKDAKVTIAKKAHSYVTDYGYAATGASTGLTNGSHCSVCGYVNVPQQTIAVIPNAVGYTYKVGSTECRIITNTDASRTVAYKNKQNTTKYQTINETVNLNGQTFTVTALKRDCVNGTYVRTLTLASSITNWEYGAFNGDNRLTKINVKSTTLNVESGAFAKMKASAKAKLKVYITKGMCKAEFNKVKAQLVKEGLKASNIRRM